MSCLTALWNEARTYCLYFIYVKIMLTSILLCMFKFFHNKTFLKYQFKTENKFCGNYQTYIQTSLMMYKTWYSRVASECFKNAYQLQMF